MNGALLPGAPRRPLGGLWCAPWKFAFESSEDDVDAILRSSVHDPSRCQNRHEVERAHGPATHQDAQAERSGALTLGEAFAHALIETLHMTARAADCLSEVALDDGDVLLGQSRITVGNVLR